MPLLVSLATSSMRSLEVRFSEHLADIRHNRSKPVAHHFNSAGHTVADVKAKGLRQLHGDSFQRKHMESHIVQRPWWTEGNFFKFLVALLDCMLLLCVESALIIILYHIRLRLVGFLAFCLLIRVLVYVMLNIIL